MNLWTFLSSHGTKVLAVAQGTVALLTTMDIIPAGNLKYWLAVSAVLTYWRGLANTTAIAEEMKK